MVDPNLWHYNKLPSATVGRGGLVLVHNSGNPFKVSRGNKTCLFRGDKFSPKIHP